MSSRIARVVALVLLLLGLAAVPALQAGAVAPKPTISKIKPAAGPASGGTKVVVKGQHLTGATSVKFGKRKGTKLTVKNDHKLTVVSPAHAAGAVKLRVKTPGGGATGTFTYVAAPSITSVAPASGLSVGGSKVTLSGTGFLPGVTVTFGGTPASAVQVSSTTSLTVTLPAHAPGPVPVVVRSGGQASGGRPFAYLAAPSLQVAPVPGADQSLGSQIVEVACPTTGTCFAVGGYGVGSDQRAMVDTLVSGSWSATAITLPGDALPSPAAVLKRISCPTATFCVAVGVYRRAGADDVPMATTWDGTAWSAATAISLPADAVLSNGSQTSDLDCFAPSACAVVGYYFTASGLRPLLLTWNGSGWSSASPALPAGSQSAGLVGVSCPASGDCWAVGRANLTGGGGRPVTGHLTAGTMTLTLPDLPGDSLSGSSTDGIVGFVTCLTVSTCYASGSYAAVSGSLPLFGRLAAGSWSLVAPALPSSVTTPTQFFAEGLACPQVSQCAMTASVLTNGQEASRLALVGTAGALTQAFGAGAPPAQAGPGATAMRPIGLVCSAAGTCVSLGSFTSGAPRRPMITRMSGGMWLTSEAVPLPPGTVAGELVSGALSSSSTVVAGGSTQVGDVGHGLLATGIPVGP